MLFVNVSCEADDLECGLTNEDLRMGVTEGPESEVMQHVGSQMHMIVSIVRRHSLQSPVARDNNV